MAKISIDLLPVEFKSEQIKSAKFYKIQTLGVGIVLFMAFLSSLTIALRILQSQSITQIQKRLTVNEQKITTLKDTQTSLLLLKNRLTAINQYLGTTSKQAQMYSLLDRLIPPSVSVSTISVNNLGDALILAVVPDGASLDNLIVSLSSAESNQNKIKQVSIESLNRGKDGTFRVSLRIVPQ